MAYQFVPYKGGIGCEELPVGNCGRFFEFFFGGIPPILRDSRTAPFHHRDSHAGLSGPLTRPPPPRGSAV